ncbi:MAG: RNA polymerase subunit sigma-24 [Bacteroidetes bacterium]|nr:MAG: RNA polymerase subunit sigma-24 [Bacteroidota bacterium]
MSAAIKSVYEQLPDSVLVELVLKEDNKAATILMYRYYEGLRHELLKMVKNRSDADYLTLQGFAKAFIKINRYSPQFAFSTWLYKIAKNNCIDFLRKKQRDIGNISIDSVHEGKTQQINVYLTSVGPNPEEQLIQKQRTQLLYRTVARLTPAYKIIIKLFYFEELAIVEISEKLEIPVNTVKVQLFRARKELQKLYDAM